MTDVLGRQWRRLGWLARDVVRSGRGLAHALAVGRHPEPTVALGVLQGAPWAVRGCDNGYLLRLVNDGPTPRRLGLAIGGTAPGAPRFEATATYDVPACSAREVHLVTDWVTRFTLADVAPDGDAEKFLVPPPATTASCRVDARLDAAEAADERLTVTQPLVG